MSEQNCVNMIVWLNSENDEWHELVLSSRADVETVLKIMRKPENKDTCAVVEGVQKRDGETAYF